MSEEFVNKVTLEYLINKEYNVAIKPGNNVNKRDKKFYRKRVFNLTKELLSSEEPKDMFPDVKIAFDNYVKQCINYFKSIDCSDILQEDYKDMSNNIYCYADMTDSIQLQEDANKMMMRSINIKPNNLDTFIKRTVKHKAKMVMPQQKDVNLRAPDLKIKGIGKKEKEKENLTN